MNSRKRILFYITNVIIQHEYSVFATHNSNMERYRPVCTYMAMFICNFQTAHISNCADVWYSSVIVLYTGPATNSVATVTRRRYEGPGSSTSMSSIPASAAGCGGGSGPGRWFEMISNRLSICSSVSLSSLSSMINWISTAVVGRWLSNWSFSAFVNWNDPKA